MFALSRMPAGTKKTKGLGIHFDEPGGIAHLPILPSLRTCVWPGSSQAIVGIEFASKNGHWTRY